MHHGAAEWRNQAQWRRHETWVPEAARLVAPLDQPAPQRLERRRRHGDLEASGGGVETEPPSPRLELGEEDLRHQLGARRARRPEREALGDGRLDRSIGEPRLAATEPGVEKEEESSQLLVELSDEGADCPFELALAALELGGADLGDPAVLQGPEHDQKTREESDAERGRPAGPRSSHEESV